MSIVHTLNEELLKQPFANEQEEATLLAECRYVAAMYARIENSIAVLSDLKANKSYIYHGDSTVGPALRPEKSTHVIDSIWEEEIFNCIHPDDLIAKHVLELQFFHLLRSLPVKERSNYLVSSLIRMKDRLGNYRPVHHRMFYVCSSSNGSLWLALCLYNYPVHPSSECIFTGNIVHSSTGETLQMNGKRSDAILSLREKEVLQLVGQGKASKEIADRLSISINTVNRHRQNILEKLRVKNSTEAYSLALHLHLI